MKQKYIDVQKWLIEKIQNNEFENGRLPTEKELGEKFKISKMTVRRVFQELKIMNLIYSIPGKGFIVSPFCDFYLGSSKEPKKYEKQIFPTNVKIPNYLIKDKSHSIDLTKQNINNWSPFIELFFKGDEVKQYSINWYYQEKKPIDFNIYRDFEKIAKAFEEDESIKTIKIVTLELIIKNDERVFNFDKNQLNQITEIPVVYEYSFSKEGIINKIKMIRFFPKNFEVLI